MFDELGMPAGKQKLQLDVSSFPFCGRIIVLQQTRGLMLVLCLVHELQVTRDLVLEIMLIILLLVLIVQCVLGGKSD